jgi:hypothetical protein
MAKFGFAPRTMAGDRIVLHHHLQNPAGFLVEIPSRYHRAAPLTSTYNNPRQHPYGTTKGAGLSTAQRLEFNKWRVEYWKWRAIEELKQRSKNEQRDYSVTE